MQAILFNASEVRNNMPAVDAVSLVFANWCPHCNPPALEAVERMGTDLGVKVNLHDIDIPESEKIADELVKSHGNWATDYLIPQIFLEFADGTIQHIFTGFAEGVAITKARMADLFQSQWYRDLVRTQKA